MLVERPISLVVAPKPFDPTVNRIQAIEGLDIAALLAHACNQGGLDPQDVRLARVYVDADLIDVRKCLDWKPRAGQVVSIVADAQGGGGGKDFGDILLQIALMAVATMVGGQIGGAAMFARMGATAVKIATSVATAAIYTAGAAALAHMNKPDTLKPAKENYSLPGLTNDYRHYQPCPLVTGPHRVAFDMAASPYTLIQGDDTFATFALGVHYGPCQVADIKVGETLLEDLPAGDWQMEQFLTPGARDSALYPSDVQEDPDPAELDVWADAPSPWEIRTLAEGATRAEVDILFPGGLSHNRTDGEIHPTKVRIIIEKAPVGTETWSSAVANTDVSARTKEPIRRMIPFDLDPGTDWKIRVKASLQPPYNATRSFTGLYSNSRTMLSAVRSYTPGEPFPDEILSIIVLRLRASAELTGASAVISGVVTPIVPTWDPEAGEGGAWTADPDVYDEETWSPSGNAIAVARYILGGYPAAFPLSASEFDASFGEHYALIEEKGWDGGAVIRDEASQDQAMATLGAQGRFTLHWNGSRMCVIPTWIRPAPVQLFTGRNAQNYSYERTFQTEIHAVRVEFLNVDEDSEPDEVTVYMDGYSKETATIIELYRFPIAVTGERAIREGRLFLAQRVHQVQTHDWTCGRDGLYATRGDRVLVRHHSTLVGTAEARVQHRRFVTPGGLVSGVRLDTPVRMEDGKTYSLVCRREDGVVTVAVATVAGLSRDLSFSTPQAQDDSPMKGDLVAFGETVAVTEDLLIADIEANDDATFSLKGVNYIAEALAEAEEGEIPPFVTTINARPSAPPPVIVGKSGSPDGAVVTFSIPPVRGAAIKAFKARWRLTTLEGDPVNAWADLPDLAGTAREVRTPSALEAGAQAGLDTPYAADVELRSVLASGEVSTPTFALNIPLGDLVLPAPPAGSFTAAPATFAGAGGSTSGIIVTMSDSYTPPDGSTGAGPYRAHPLADAIVIVYAPSDASSVGGAETFNDVTQRVFELKGLAPEEDHDVAIYFLFRKTPGEALFINGVASGALTSGNTLNVGGRTSEQINDDLEVLLDETGGAAASAAIALAAKNDALAAANVATNAYDSIVTRDGNPHFADGLTGWESPGHDIEDVLATPVVTDATGGKVLRNITPGANLAIQSAGLFPVDTTKRYRIKVKFRSQAASSPVTYYFGFIGCDANGDPVDHGDYGSYRYAAEHGLTYSVAAGWQVRDNVIAGVGNDSYQKFPPGTVQVRLYGILNYDDVADAVCDVDYFYLVDAEAQEQAATHALTAQGHAETASNSELAAAQSKITAVQRSTGGFNPNPTFEDYPGSGLPEDWDGGSGTYAKVEDPDGNGVRMTAAAGQDNVWLYRNIADIISPGEWIVAEVDIVLADGALTGAAVGVGFYNSAFSVGYATGAVDNQFNFSSTPDTTETIPGAGVVDRRYSYRRLMRAATDAGVTSVQIIVAGHYSGYGSIAAANEIVVKRANFRRATAEEVKARKAFNGEAGSAVADLDTAILNALVSYASDGSTVSARMGALSAHLNVTSEVAVDAMGRSRTQWEVVGDGPGDADFFVRASTLSDPEDPDSDTSHVGIGCEEFSVNVPVAGEYRRIIRADGTLVEIDADLKVNGRLIFPGGVTAPVGAQSTMFSVTDGQAKTWGPWPQAPDFSYDMSSLPVLTGGESYKFYVNPLSGSGGTFRLKKTTFGSDDPQATISVGGASGPAAVTLLAEDYAKPAWNGVYEPTVNVSDAPIAYIIEGAGPHPISGVWSPFWVPYYQASMDCHVFDSTDTWVFVGSLSSELTEGAVDWDAPPTAPGAAVITGQLNYGGDFDPTYPLFGITLTAGSTISGTPSVAHIYRAHTETGITDTVKVFETPKNQS